LCRVQSSDHQLSSTRMGCGVSKELTATTASINHIDLDAIIKRDSLSKPVIPSIQSKSSFPPIAGNLELNLGNNYLRLGMSIA
jgi:hypothetical protein